MFLIVLQSDLFLLRSSLDDWIGAGCPMEETRKELEAMKQPVERLHKLLNTCTDISDFNEVDGFKCSNCGIEITDFCRVERDEDDGSESYHEFILKYCPNCGRFIKRDE